LIVIAWESPAAVYGGFMTNWILGHTDRFKAAVTLAQRVQFHQRPKARATAPYGHEEDFRGNPVRRFRAILETRRR